MFNKNLIAGVILAGAIAIAGTAPAYAVKRNDSPQDTPNISGPVRIKPKGRQVRIKFALDGLVRKGTITEAQQDAVLKALSNKDGKCTSHGRKNGFLRDLVKEGIITQDQADAIRDAIKSARESVKKPG